MRRLVPVGVPLLLWGGVVVACSTENQAVDRGGECSLATDCVPGLVCVEQKNGKRICTDDLSGVVGDAPGSGGGEDEAGPGGEGGAGEGGTTDRAVPPDSTVEDRTPPKDTGVDVGTDTGGGDTGAD